MSGFNDDGGLGVFSKSTVAGLNSGVKMHILPMMTLMGCAPASVSPIRMTTSHIKTSSFHLLRRAFGGTLMLMMRALGRYRSQNTHRPLLKQGLQAMHHWRR